ncbi:uncharacterized protein METZ01_LOCUS440745, partial [marine metagenome]
IWAHPGPRFRSSWLGDPKYLDHGRKAILGAPAL